MDEVMIRQLRTFVIVSPTLYALLPSFFWRIIARVPIIVGMA